MRAPRALLQAKPLAWALRRVLDRKIRRERARLEQARDVLVASGQVVEVLPPVEVMALWQSLQALWMERASRERVDLWTRYRTALLAAGRDDAAREGVHRRYQAQLQERWQPAEARLAQGMEEAGEAARAAVATVWERHGAAWQQDLLPNPPSTNGGQCHGAAQSAWFGLSSLERQRQPGPGREG